MRIFLINIALILCFTACSDYKPKPYGYFRIDLPENEYVEFDSVSPPCVFDISKYATVNIRKAPDRKEEFVDISYPSFNGKIYCSYLPITGDFYQLSEDSRSLVYKHSIRADAIAEKPFENPEAKVYGILYEIQGNAASPAQFVLTDSVKHFLRGSVYFNATPNADSIAPVSAFVEEDLRRLIETIRWK
jgi:gliding motility-associated lipoprotein GldD